MPRTSTQHDLLSQIPSPSRRLGVGLLITLTIFGAFAFYVIREVRNLEYYQTNVVQRNRLASIQLQQLQESTFYLATSLRDMTLPESRYPIGYWRGEYSRVKEEMTKAFEHEAQYAATTPAGNEKRAQLRRVLEDFWETADQAFTLADQGHEDTARYLIRSQLESKREIMSRLIQSLLTLNFDAQAEAGQRITEVYNKVQRDMLLVIGVFFLVVLGTGLYTLQANRKTFARLHDLAGQLQVQNRQLAALYEAISAVSQEQEPRKVLQDGCEQLSRALGAERVAFFRYHPEGARFTLGAATGGGPEPNVSHLLPLREELAAGRMAKIPSGGGDAAVGIPLVLGSALFGAFVLNQPSGAAPYREDDLRLASKIVEATLGPLKNAQLLDQLKVQSEQLRKLSWKLIEIQEETLRQVARDLHDEFGQILTAIGTMLGRAGQKGLAKDSPFVQEVEQVKKIVEETLQTVRSGSQIFRPAILDDFGLEHTLEWLALQFTRQTGIDVHFEGRMTDEYFPAEDAIHVYRIVQEALSNVARHSKTDEAWVRVEESASELCVEILDRGAGFDPDGEMDRVSGEGVGLMGMRERAEHLSGKLTLESAPGRGTTVRVRIPLKRAPSRTVVEKVTQS